MRKHLLAAGRRRLPLQLVLRARTGSDSSRPVVLATLLLAGAQRRILFLVIALGVTLLFG